MPNHYKIKRPNKVSYPGQYRAFNQRKLSTNKQEPSFSFHFNYERHTSRPLVCQFNCVGFDICLVWCCQMKAHYVTLLWGMSVCALTMCVPITTIHSGNTKHLYNICTMLDQRRRSWADVLEMVNKFLTESFVQAPSFTNG